MTLHRDLPIEKLENMTTNPYFSVIVATRNCVELLPRTITSIKDQEDVDWECLIQDCASTDGTVEYMAGESASDDRIQFKSKSDSGIGDAWNRALLKSNGAWIIFLGAGDWLPSNALSRIRKASLIHPESKILVGDVAKIDSEGVLSTIIYGRSYFRGPPSTGFKFMHPGVAVKRNVFDEVGLFRPDVRIAVDSEHLLRCYLKKMTLGKSFHTVAMLDGGVSQRNWCDAQLEYANIFSSAVKLGKWRHRGLISGTYLRWIFFHKLRLGGALGKAKNLTGRVLIALLNMGLRYLPGFTLRRLALNITGCKISKTAAIHRGVRIFSFGKISVGNYSTVNRGVFLDNRCEISIGDCVSISHDSRIYTLGHDLNDPYFKLRGAPVRIDNYAVVFANATILPGTTLCEGAVVETSATARGLVGEYEIFAQSAQRDRQARLKQLEYKVLNSRWLAS